jgi:hypothetical protein
MWNRHNFVETENGFTFEASTDQFRYFRPNNRLPKPVKATRTSEGQQSIHSGHSLSPVATPAHALQLPFAAATPTWSNGEGGPLDQRQSCSVWLSRSARFVIL